MKIAKYSMIVVASGLLSSAAFADDAKSAVQPAVKAATATADGAVKNATAMKDQKTGEAAKTATAMKDQKTGEAAKVAADGKQSVEKGKSEMHKHKEAAEHMKGEAKGKTEEVKKEAGKASEKAMEKANEKAMEKAGALGDKANAAIKTK